MGIIFVVSCLALAESADVCGRQRCVFHTRRRQARRPENCSELALSNASCPTRTASSTAPMSPTMVLHFTQRVTFSGSSGSESVMTKSQRVSDTIACREELASRTTDPVQDTGRCPHIVWGTIGPPAGPRAAHGCRPCTDRRSCRPPSVPSAEARPATSCRHKRSEPELKLHKKQLGHAGKGEEE